MTIAPDIHESYGVLMVASVVLLLCAPTTRHFTNASDRGRYYTMQAITALGAVAGAKLGVLFGDALWPLRQFDDWSALLVSGRSIAGALLLGFLAVEAAKPLLGYDIPPNDRFAVVLPFSIGIGRVGCLVAGCCRGAPWDGPFAVVYDDGIPRHPAQLYEALFQLVAGWVLLRLWRRNALFGRLFALYLAAYGLFRFATEFIRDTAKPFAGLSAYQWMSLAMVVAGATAIYLRSRGRPASWRRWQLKGEAA
jgi:phosphatidylglycerol:prolipoprotein diacylglycerol transferase